MMKQKHRARDTPKTTGKRALTIVLGFVCLPAGYYAIKAAHSSSADIYETRSNDSVMAISFAEAQLFPAKRQAYLDELLQGVDLPYCEAVLYDPDGSQILSYRDLQLAPGKNSPHQNAIFLEREESLFQGGQYHIYTPSIINRRGKGEHTAIFVGQKAFTSDLFQNDEDLKAALVAHEQRHVLQYAQGMNVDQSVPPPFIDHLLEGRITLKTVYDIAELDAQQQELMRIKQGEFRVSDSYLTSRRNEFYQNKSRLETMLSFSSPAQAAYIKAALRSYGTTAF
ncbi:hypothetical protein HYX14_00910 [Candidatus Woesearchaeota archaeon]|nr:hypothetical protein [Candidatus Woesearchaeota archaeon]